MLLLLSCIPETPSTRNAPSSDSSEDSGPRSSSIDLSCPQGPLHLELLAEGVLQIRYGDSIRPSWVVLPQDPPAQPKIWEEDGSIILGSEHLVAVVEMRSCRLRVEDAQGRVLLSEPEGGGWKEGSLERELGEEEQILGMGERTGTALDRRGRSLRCWTTDAYDDLYGGWAPQADPLYQCIPYYISMKEGQATGIFTDLSWDSQWDIGATLPERLSLQTEATSIEQYVIAGPTIREVAARYGALTGKPPLPPLWSLGFAQSRWGWSREAEVRQVVADFQARSLPLASVWLDIEHMDGYRSWTWNRENFPDPGQLLQDLDAQGIAVVSIVDPGLKVDPEWEIYQQGLTGGYYLGTGGVPWQGEVWPGTSVFPDFSNPGVRSWWGAMPAADMELGIDGFWLDMNEPSEFTQGTVPDQLQAHGEGIPTTMAELHNLYGLLELRATWEGMQKIAPERRPFLLTRSGYAGVQRYATAWTGDAPSSWESLAQTPAMLLGMSLSGQSWVGSDVGGYSGGASPELYARWMQVGAFSPFFRAHLVQGTTDQYPWSFGTEVEDLSRELLKLRSRLLPYWYSLAREASRSGTPPMRPLLWDWPEMEARGDQWMVGPWIFVAPLLEEGATERELLLPAGDWYEFYTGIHWEGPQSLLRSQLPLAALPLLVREGAILPTAAADSLQLELWPAEEETFFDLYEDAGSGADYLQGAYAISHLALKQQTDGARLQISREGSWDPGPRWYRIHVNRVDHAPTEVFRDGLPMEALSEKESLREGWWWDPAELALWVLLPDTGVLDLQMRYDPSLLSDAPAVEMPFRVQLPPGTPTDSPIHIISSADGWSAHHPLTRVSSGSAEGTLIAPRGDYLYYKYTRGSWETVEKWPDCAEASNRYELGRATPVKEDVVYGWRDFCP